MNALKKVEHLFMKSVQTRFSSETQVY